MKIIIKTTWHVTKDGEEVGRYSTRKMAECVAKEICGFVHKSTVEYME